MAKVRFGGSKQAKMAAGSAVVLAAAVLAVAGAAYGAKKLKDDSKENEKDRR